MEEAGWEPRESLCECWDGSCRLQMDLPGHFCFRFPFVLDALTRVGLLKCFPQLHICLGWEVKEEWGSGLECGTSWPVIPVLGSLRQRDSRPAA